MHADRTAGIGIVHALNADLSAIKRGDRYNRYLRLLDLH